MRKKFSDPLRAKGAKSVPAPKKTPSRNEANPKLSTYKRATPGMTYKQNMKV